METELKKVREELNMTQMEASKLLGISRRSYQTYENDETYQTTIKYRYLLQTLRNILEDENQGIPSIEYIKTRSEAVFRKYDVSYCYLFGSYAKGTPRPDSDIDLLVSANISGLAFFGMVEELRNALHKQLDVLQLTQLEGNKELLNEILMNGVKIYG